ncbi:SIR2 family NAD-dependent protein deacylase [Helcobacillus massiliensis]|uniref:SIR2 family NAD-dependent protein deacylase n=1 Tax=Helcobacillus massiliensis TaxID=521392 RepID=UPI00162308B3|nr:Sir2 family NAD-dependent protein deacetylase [Helcobacillus massiliensis]
MGGVQTRAFELRPHHRRVVALTGAGLSAAAGLRTFRGPGGLWEEDPLLEASMDVAALPDSLDHLWQVWGGVFETAAVNGPTPGHRALARIGAQVLTQNVDGLHQVAGSRDVAELHGSAAHARCLNDDCPWRADLVAGQAGAVPRDLPERYGAPSACPLCGERTRPDVVLFGEMLDVAVIEAAERAARSCDVFLAVGTSNTVAPAALLAPLARSCGAVTVCIDPRATTSSVSAVFDHVIAEDAHTVLPRWAQLRDKERRNPFLEPF